MSEDMLELSSEFFSFLPIQTRMQRELDYIEHVRTHIEN
jgi:hypothetical protein